jgi:large subunit ribosomal protein L25
MKKENPKLSGTLRTVTGRKVKKLRQAGQIPATIYGQAMTPISVQFTALELDKIFEHAGESTLVEINIDKETYPVIFKNPQFHPVLGDLIHIDCYQVNLKEKIVANVPLELIGESPAVKNGNILVPVTDEVEIEALPADLPEKIEVDISSLEEIGQKISVSDLQVDQDLIEIKTDPEQVIAIIEEPKVEEEPVEEEVAPEDVPATAQKSEEGGEEGTDQDQSKDSKASEEKPEN